MNESARPLYQGRVYRPPSEADALIVQATLGCSWNHCSYCDMYRDKGFQVRPLAALVAELGGVAAQGTPRKLFLADGDALAMPVDHAIALLESARALWPKLRRVSCYATARNLLECSEDELSSLREAGLTRLYIGPESGDDSTLKAIAKGASAAQHVEAAARAHAAGMEQSVIFLLGAGGRARSRQHALQSAALCTQMDPEFVALLTLTVVPGTPIFTQQARGDFVLPEPLELLEELRTFIQHASPTNALFRTNHASNYLSLRGRLPADRASMLALLDEALQGKQALRPEWSRGL